MIDKIITLLKNKELTGNTKEIIVANYFDILCSDDSIIDLLKKNELTSGVARTVIEMYTILPYYDSNPKIINLLEHVIDNRNQYKGEVVEASITALAYYDSFSLVDNFIDSGRLEDMSPYYGAFIEYITLLIGNNFNRADKILEMLFDKYEFDESSKGVLAGNVVLDIVYTYSDKLELKFDDKTRHFIETINSAKKLSAIEGALKFVGNTFHNFGVCFLDYNPTLGSLHRRYENEIKWISGDASIANNINDYLKCIIDKVTLGSIGDSDHRTFMYKEIATWIGKNSGFIYGVPCAHSGQVNGVLLLHTQTKIDNLTWIEAIVICKHIGGAIARAESDLQALTYYSDFIQKHDFAVRSFSHQVNRALGSLKSSLLELNTEHYSRDDFDSIEHCRYTGLLISDALDAMLKYSNPERRRESIENVIKIVLKVMYVEIKRRKVVITSKYDQDNPYLMMGPGVMTVITSLITNAMEALADNPVNNRSIKIISELCKSDRIIKVRIIDNGKGILEKDRDKIFKDRYSTKGGMGIGLTMANKLMSELGGAIYLEDNKEGTEFILEFPLEDSLEKNINCR